MSRRISSGLIADAFKSTPFSSCYRKRGFYIKPKVVGNTNACFQTLKKELDSYPDLQRVIDSLCEECEQTIPKKVRNKVLAHLDLNVMQSGLPFAPMFSSLEQLVNHTCDTLTLISHYIYPGDVIFPDNERLISQIESYFPFNISKVGVTQRTV